MKTKKQLVINMIAQIISFITNIVIGFFLTPYIVKHVGKEAYGFVGLANNFISYATIVTTALNSMAGRFITISIHQKRYEDANKYFTSVFFANVITAIPLTLAAVVILIFLDRIINVPVEILSDVTILWSLLFANFIVGLLGTVFGVATFSQNRLELSSLRTIEANLLKVAILLLLYGIFKPSVYYWGISTLVYGIYVILTNIWYTEKLLPFIRIRKIYIDINKIKELLASGFWNSLTKISSTLSTGLDLIISNLFIGASAMGIISISKTLPTYTLSAFGMLSSVFMPQLTISYAKEDYTSFKEQLFASIRLLGFFACIPIACLYVYGEVFFMLWMPEQDNELLQILTFMGTMAFPLSLSLEPIWNIFTVTNKVKQSSVALIISSIISVVGTLFIVALTDDDNVKMLIITGFSTFIGLIRTAFFLPVYGAKCVGFKWYTFYPVMIKVILSVIITVLNSLLIKNVLHISNWIDLIIAVCLTAIFACIINYYIMLKKSERELLKIKISKVFKRRK